MVEQHLFQAVRLESPQRAQASPEPAVDPPAIALLVLASPDAVTQVRSTLRGFVTALEIPMPIADAAVFAASEAVMNIVRHAYASDELGTVELQADFQDGTLEVVICDRGAGLHGMFGEGVGRGLALIGELADEHSVADSSPHGVEVWMRFDVGA